MRNYVLPGSASRRISRRAACGLLIITSALGLARAGEDPQGDNPRLGGLKGKLNDRISRAPWEEVDVPDVLHLRDGRKREAYFLDVHGDWFVYWVKETDRSWVKEEVQRSDVASVDFSQYLDQDPMSARKIEPAKKQPVPKEDILSGVFTALQGRSTRWRISFQSGLDRRLDYAEDATEYGTVEIESTWSHRGGRNSIYMPKEGSVSRGHTVKGTGRYHLHAPHTVNNDEWVLTFSEMILTEIDYGRDTSIYTSTAPDETMILYFTPGQDGFRLAWSNLGSWTWTSLTGIDFWREPEDARGVRGVPPYQPTREPFGSSAASRPILARAEGAPGAVAKKKPPVSRLAGWKQPGRRWP